MKTPLQFAPRDAEDCAILPHTRYKLMPRDEDAATLRYLRISGHLSETVVSDSCFLGDWIRKNPTILAKFSAWPVTSWLDGLFAPTSCYRSVEEYLDVKFK